MHRLQKHILELLIHNPSQRYSQLRPKNIEPNQFVYHLKQLVQLGLVTKTGKGVYALTAKGRSLADKTGNSSLEVAWELQPRVVLFLLVHDKERGWLLTKRTTQPTINRIGFITSDIYPGEAVSDTASTLLASYGLGADFSYRCSGINTFYKDQEIESFVSFTLLYASTAKGELTPGAPARWYQLDELDMPDILPNTKPLIEIALKENATFTEFSYNL